MMSQCIILVTFLLNVSLLQASFKWPKLPDLPDIGNLPVFAHPNPVDSLEVSGVLGRWFQMYTSLIPSTTFEKDGYCIVADMLQETSTTPDANVVTLNFAVTGNVGSATGSTKKVQGTLINSHFESDPGEFSITFDSTTIDMWFIALGDMNDTGDHIGQYPWVVISDELGSNLFILARDVTEFESMYKEDVLNLVKRQGFVWPSNKPIKTFQSVTECVYPPEPTTTKDTTDTTSTSGSDIASNVPVSGSGADSNSGVTKPVPEVPPVVSV